MEKEKQLETQINQLLKIWHKISNRFVADKREKLVKLLNSNSKTEFNNLVNEFIEAEQNYMNTKKEMKNVNIEDENLDLNNLDILIFDYQTSLELYSRLYLKLKNYYDEIGGINKIFI